MTRKERRALAEREAERITREHRKRMAKFLISATTAVALGGFIGYLGFHGVGLGVEVFGLYAVVSAELI